jgi:hypothetical protein
MSQCHVQRNLDCTILCFATTQSVHCDYAQEKYTEDSLKDACTFRINTSTQKNSGTFPALDKKVAYETGYVMTQCHVTMGHLPGIRVIEYPHDTATVQCRVHLRYTLHRVLQTVWSYSCISYQRYTLHRVLQTVWSYSCTNYLRYTLHRVLQTVWSYSCTNYVRYTLHRVLQTGVRGGHLTRGPHGHLTRGHALILVHLVFALTSQMPIYAHLSISGMPMSMPR